MVVMRNEETWRETMDISDVSETRIENQKFSAVGKVLMLSIFSIILFIIHLVMDIVNRGYATTSPLNTELWIHELNSNNP